MFKNYKMDKQDLEERITEKNLMEGNFILPENISKGREKIMRLDFIYIDSSPISKIKRYISDKLFRPYYKIILR